MREMLAILPELTLHGIDWAWEGFRWFYSTCKALAVIGILYLIDIPLVDAKDAS